MLLSQFGERVAWLSPIEGAPQSDLVMSVMARLTEALESPEIAVSPPRHLAWESPSRRRQIALALEGRRVLERIRNLDFLDRFASVPPDLAYRSGVVEEIVFAAREVLDADALFLPFLDADIHLFEYTAQIIRLARQPFPGLHGFMVGDWKPFVPVVFDQYPWIHLVSSQELRDLFYESHGARPFVFTPQDAGRLLEAHPEVVLADPQPQTGLCPVCAAELSTSQVIFCGICRTPAHRECAEYNDWRCSIFGCRGGYAPPSPLRI